MPGIETIISPATFHLYEEGVENKNVVVIDILRATTTICTAFDNGATEILPVSKPEDASALQALGWIAAAERQGQTVAGFDLGNSPQDFTRDRVFGKKIAITTTNGTRALQMCEAAKGVYIGAFLNLSALAAELVKQNLDVMLFCAGWKDKFNLEDTLFAGALAKSISHHFTISDDATHAAVDLYALASEDLYSYLQKANHVQRFTSLHIESDLDVCLKRDTTKTLPVFKNGIITATNHV